MLTATIATLGNTPLFFIKLDITVGAVFNLLKKNKLDVGVVLFSQIIVFYYTKLMINSKKDKELLLQFSHPSANLKLTTILGDAFISEAKSGNVFLYYATNSFYSAVGSILISDKLFRDHKEENEWCIRNGHSNVKGIDPYSGGDKIRRAIGSDRLYRIDWGIHTRAHEDDTSQKIIFENLTKNNPEAILNFLSYIGIDSAIKICLSTSVKPQAVVYLSSLLLNGTIPQKSHLNTKLFFRGLNFIYDNTEPKEVASLVVANVLSKYKTFSTNPEWSILACEFTEEKLVPNGFDGDKVFGVLYKKMSPIMRKETFNQLTQADQTHNVVLLSTESTHLYSLLNQINDKDDVENKKMSVDDALTGIKVSIKTSGALRKYGIANAIVSKQSKSSIAAGEDDIQITLILKNRLLNKPETTQVVTYLLNSLIRSDLLRNRSYFEADGQQSLDKFFHSLLLRHELLSLSENKEVAKAVKCKA